MASIILVVVGGLTRARSNANGRRLNDVMVVRQRREVGR